jgi:hypothetical protein
MRTSKRYGGEKLWGTTNGKDQSGELVIAWLGDSRSIEVTLALLQMSASDWRMFDTIRRLCGLAGQSAPEDVLEFFATLSIYWYRACITQELALAARVKLMEYKTEWDLSKVSDKGLDRAQSSINDYFHPYEIQKLAIERYDTRNKSLPILLVSVSQYALFRPARSDYFAVIPAQEGNRGGVDYELSEVDLLRHVLKASNTPCRRTATIVTRTLDLTTLLESSHALHNNPFLREYFCMLDIGSGEASLHAPQAVVTALRYHWCRFSLYSSWPRERGIVSYLRSVCATTQWASLLTQIRLVEGRRHSSTHRVDQCVQEAEGHQVFRPDA